MGSLANRCSKVFDCLSHSLLIGKFHATVFDKTSTEYLKRLFESSETKDKNKQDV